MNVIHSNHLPSDPAEITDAFGSRVASLAVLKNFEYLGFRVPSFCATLLDFSSRINARLGKIPRKHVAVSPSYFRAPDDLEQMIWNHALESTRKSLLDSFLDFSKVPKIIRGTSRMEGSSPLSFAGVCYSHLPGKKQTRADIEGGISGVLAGPRSSYGYYYKKVHKLPDQFFDVGIITLPY